MGGLFKKPKVPDVPKPTPLPDPVEQVAARKRGIAKTVKEKGFQSTILSSGGKETLGG